MICITKQELTQFVERRLSKFKINPPKYEILRETLVGEGIKVDGEKVYLKKEIIIYIGSILVDKSLPITIVANDKFEWCRSHKSKVNNIVVIRDEFNTSSGEIYYCVIEGSDMIIKTNNVKLFKLLKSRYDIFYHSRVKRKHHSETQENFNF